MFLPGTLVFLALCSSLLSLQRHRLFLQDCLAAEQLGELLLLLLLPFSFPPLRFTSGMSPKILSDAFEILTYFSPGTVFHRSL